MRHVLVETNWVVVYAAPAHARVAEADALVQSAENGLLGLHIPAICLTEGRHPVRRKYQPRMVDELRRYVAWALVEAKLTPSDGDVVRRVLQTYENQIASELDQVEQTLGRLRSMRGIDIFPLNQAMLDRAVDLSLKKLDLKPFDQAILAAVLVRAEELRAEGADDVCFCELDSDLQPWDKKGDRKEPLESLYDAAHVRVYGDFSMQTRPRPSRVPG